nr:hypothetical protein [Thiothrix nivea]
MLKHQSSEFYPVEWVHGVIQVKSCLRNKKTIKDGLKNIASFKRLKKSGVHINKFNGGQITSNTTRGFGILFAYKATLKWGSIIDAIKEFMKDSPSTEWPNAIVILDLGMIIPFNKEENIGCEFTQDIDKLKEIDVIGIPNRGDCLLRFYSTLTKLLNRSQLGGFDFWDYIRLPFTSGEISYSFTHGQFSETGNCKIHGKYLRNISQDALKKILSVCENAEPINWIKATDIAYGKKGDNIEAYLRQPGDVLIYNPDNEQLSDILIFKENSAIAFDFIDIEGKQYWIPYYYSIKDNLVTVECPKCKKSNKLYMVSTVNPFQQRSNKNPQGAVPVPFGATAHAGFFA